MSQDQNPLKRQNEISSIFGGLDSFNSPNGEEAEKVDGVMQGVWETFLKIVETSPENVSSFGDLVENFTPPENTLPTQILIPSPDFPLGDKVFSAISRGICPTPDDFVRAILTIAQNTKKTVEQIISESSLNNLPTKNLALPGTDNVNWKTLLHNRWKNWGRLLIPRGKSVLDLAEVPYDELHRDGYYLFTERDEPNHFLTDRVLSYKNGTRENPISTIVKGKVLAVIGGGAGSDEACLLENQARGVISIDSSLFIQDELLKKFSACQTGNPQDLFDQSKTEKKFYLETENPDMFQALETMIEKEIRVDTVYAHSAFHYFDDSKLQHLFSLIEKVLSPGGHLVFAIKAFGATLDGEGIFLLDKKQTVVCEGENGRTSRNKSEHRAYFSSDGQTRHFRAMDSLKKILKNAGFEIKEAAEFSVDDYETEGVSQPFLKIKT